MEEGKSSDVIQDASPRENMIGTAVKFLQNPKVRSSPFEQRKIFLKNKGLTEEEIAIAVERSGTSVDETIQSQQHNIGNAQGNNNALVPSGYVPQTPLPVSKWQKTRDFTSTVIVIGGFSYAVYIIYKRYIAPYFFGPSEEEKHFAQLTSSIKQLQETMSEMVRTMDETSRVLSQQRENIQQLSTNSGTSIGRGSSDLVNVQNNQSINEIKEEIKSLKGLLLSRRQFPTAPVTTPVVPSWQVSVASSAINTTTSIGHITSTTSSLNGKGSSPTSLTFEDSKIIKGDDEVLLQENENLSLTNLPTNNTDVSPCQDILSLDTTAAGVTDITEETGTYSMDSENNSDLLRESLSQKSQHSKLNSETTDAQTTHSVEDHVNPGQMTDNTITVDTNDNLDDKTSNANGVEVA